MIDRDMVVAAIAFGLGGFMIFSSLTNHDRTFQIATPRMLAEAYGRTCARWVMGMIGLIVFLLGAYLVCKPNGPATSDNRESAPGTIAPDHFSLADFAIPDSTGPRSF